MAPPARESLNGSSGTARSTSFQSIDTTSTERSKAGAGSARAVKAALNFGDCFSYALSIATRHPLLYIGDDFSLTDVPTTTEDPA